MTQTSRFFTSKGFLLFAVIIIFVMVLAFFFGDSGILEIIKKQRKIEDLNHSIVELRKKKELLIKEIDELKVNPLAMEKVAREKLWLMKKNEKVVVLVHPREKKDDIQVSKTDKK